MDIVYLKELNLLVLTQKKLRGLTPVRGVFPTVFDQTGWMAIDLGVILGAILVGNPTDHTFEQVSHLKIAPFLPSFGRLMLTPIPSRLASASGFTKSCLPSLPGILPAFDGDKESVARDARVDAAV